MSSPTVHLATCGKWHLNQTAKAFHERGSLAGLWLSENDRTSLPREKVHRAWRFHAGMKPFYHLAPQLVTEKAFYALFPLWRSWIESRQFAQADVVHAIMGYATEPFDHADRMGALKVVDAPNSHPTTFFGYWQRECDLWCPGETVPIPRWMFARMNRELQRADLVLAPSKFCRQSMVENGIPDEKILVSPFGVDTSIFKKRESVPEKPRFISVGTICLRKGHQYLFRAFEIVKKSLPDSELICVGGYKADFRLERPKWEGSFSHYSHLPQQELSELLRTCTAFVFPSQEEGLARVQIEALAVGLPVIGTHEGGATTVVDDGIEGFIVPAGNPEKIAAAMIKVAQDRDLNRRMGEAAYRRGAEKNTWLDYGDRLLAEYAKRLAVKRQSAP